MTNPRPVGPEDLPLDLADLQLSRAQTPDTVLIGASPVGASPVGPPAAAAPLSTRMSEELITCPECGEISTIDIARRRAEDFCPACDYPLFWARSAVITPSGEETGASLRRLPGTVGRAATAALNCPHCTEPNSPTALVCIRCGGDMHPVAPPPLLEPEPVYVAPPPPAPEPEIEDDRFWWILGIAIAVLIVVILVVWAVQR